MSSHLQTSRHYRVTVGTTEGVLYSIHLMQPEVGELRVALFIRDQEAIDEAYQAVREAHHAMTRDAIGQLRSETDQSYVWDWEVAEWVKAIATEPAPGGKTKSFPF